MTRDDRYDAFKRQVEWDGWSATTRSRFDDLFPEPERRSDEMSTMLKRAENKFLTNPTNKNAGHYLRILRDQEQDADIDNDDFQNGLAAIETYLLGKE